MENKQKQLNFYLNLLKEGEILLLKSTDTFFKNHFIGSPLNVLTNFSGSEGEAVIEKKGGENYKIKIFVDTRYHILVDKQVYPEIEVYKMPLGETFFEAFQKNYKKGTKMFVSSKIAFCQYLLLDKYFNLEIYKLNQEFEENKDLNKNAPVFLADKNVEKIPFKEKIEKINDGKNKLIFNLDEISYLTNLRSFEANYSSNFRSILYLDFKTSNHILFLDKPLENIEIEGLSYKKLDEFSDFIKKIDEKIYIAQNDISLENFLAIKKPAIDKEKKLTFISSIKPKSVILDMIEASSKLDRAIFNFKNKLKEGLSECALVEIFEEELLAQNLVTTSFKTILALRENSASIHYSSYDKNKILQKENLILLDCGGYSASGYATDITRTFYFGQNPHPYYKKIYTNVLKAFIRCFASKEREAQKVDLIARDFLKPLEKEGFYFNHGLGHGIGTSCHQNPPRLSNVSGDEIFPNQTHSIEPGLYGKNPLLNLEFGVRIENCVYFDESYKRHSLSKFPFEEILIDYSLLNDFETKFVQNWQKGWRENL